MDASVCYFFRLAGTRILTVVEGCVSANFFVTYSPVFALMATAFVAGFVLLLRIVSCFPKVQASAAEER